MFRLMVSPGWSALMVSWAVLPCAAAGAADPASTATTPTTIMVVLIHAFIRVSPKIDHENREHHSPVATPRKAQSPEKANTGCYARRHAPPAAIPCPPSSPNLASFCPPPSLLCASVPLTLCPSSQIGFVSHARPRLMPPARSLMAVPPIGFVLHGWSALMPSACSLMPDPPNWVRFARRGCPLGDKLRRVGP